MPTENRSSSNHATRTFTLDSLTAALEQVQAFHEISADLIAENVFGQPAQQGQGEPVALPARFAGIRTLAERACGRPKESPEYRSLMAELNPTMLLDLTAYPAEVERLRAELALSKRVLVVAAEEHSATQAKLAEAQALLREVQPCISTWCNGRKSQLRAMIDAHLSASAEPSAPLPPVDGDLLPPINSKVLIHLGREDKWVEHTVVGYYAWGNHGLDQNVHRVFVRVRDAEGCLNARLLNDIRPVTLERKP